MHFVFYGKDKKGALQVRVDNRPAHVEWLKSNPIVLAGPMLDENGDMSGSMVVCEAEDGIRDQPRSRGLGDVYKRQWQMV